MGSQTTLVRRPRCSQAHLFFLFLFRFSLFLLPSVFYRVSLDLALVSSRLSLFGTSYVDIYKINRCAPALRRGAIHGVLKFADGNAYEGAFKNGKMEGMGVYSFANGGRCEGELKSGSFNGQVVCKYADGESYKGEFVEGKIQQ